MTQLHKLNDYAEKGSKHNVIQNYSATQQTAFKKLLSKIETKLNEWRTEKVKSEKSSNNSSPENPPWYKTPLGIMGIIGAIALLTGVIFYYYYTASTSEKKKSNI